MKKVLIIGLSGMLVLSSCGTSAGTGAYVGGQFGHVIGSAIGGISGGWRGHELGSLIGTVGGAVAGAAIGSAIDNSQQNQSQRTSTTAASRQYDDSGFDATGSGDDRINFDGEAGYSIAHSQTVDATAENVAHFDGYRLSINPALEIRNARVVDDNENMVLTRGEKCAVSFEIMNNSDKPLYNVQPMVIEVSGNKHVHISPNLNIESIPPKQGVRYTATILADSRLKDGEAVIRIAVAQNNKEITSQIQQFTIPTRRMANR